MTMNVGKVSVGLSLDDKEFKRKIIEADNLTKKTSKSWQDSVKQLNDVSEKLKLAKASYDTNSKALEEMRKEMDALQEPTTEMKDKFLALVEEVDKGKIAYEGFIKEQDKLTGEIIKKENEYKNAKEKAKELHATEKELEKEQGKLKTSFTSVTKSIKDFSIKILTLGTLAKLTQVVFNFGKTCIKTSADFEQLATQFNVMVGNIKSKELVDDLVELAAKTPLTTEALSENAKTLLSFGESVDNILDDLKMLGDIAGGDTVKMSSLTLAFSQIGSTGRLMGQDLLQLINAGFNPLQIMAEKTGKSMGQLKDEMSKGLITFDMVKDAMKSATSEGGRFFNNMQAQSETLNGKISTLSDNWTILNKNIGDKFTPYVKTAVDKLIALASAIEHPLNVQLNILDGSLKAVGNALKGMRDIVGHLIPGTNNLANIFARLNTTAGQLGLALQFVLAPLEALQNNKSFADVSKKIGMISAQWRGLNDTYKNTLTGGQFKPLLEDLEKVNKAVSDNKKGFISDITPTATNSSSGLSKTLNEYQNFVEQYKQATNEYEATLKARNYIEKSLKIKNTDDDYQTALNVYKEYFAKRQEIEESQAQNKASLLKMEETKLQQDLQTIALQKTDETAKKQYDLLKSYQDNMRSITLEEQAYQAAGGYLASFGDSFQQRLNIEKNYYTEREKIMQMAFNSETEKQEAYNELALLRTSQLAQLQLNTWRGYGHDIKSIFDSTFSTMLTNYGSFGENMQQLALNISKKLLEIALQETLKMISFEKMKQAAILATKAIKGAFSFGIGALFHSGGTIVPTEKHHYGGITTPDQTEHFALLKNNERVLSPAETSAYNQNESSQNGQNYIVYAPQVRAMDSRDVAQWFNDNKQQVISIVADGIKNNNQGLRTQIQGI